MSSLATIVRTGVVAVAVASQCWRRAATPGLGVRGIDGECHECGRVEQLRPGHAASVEPASARRPSRSTSAPTRSPSWSSGAVTGPVVDLPVPDGWKVQNDLDAAPYGAIVCEDRGAEQSSADPGADVEADR